MLERPGGDATERLEGTAPAIVPIGVAIAVLNQTGELEALDLEGVVATQITAPRDLLFGPAYSDCPPRYRLLTVQARPPEVLSVGSSRAMETFCTAGGATLRAADPKTFLDHIPESVQRWHRLLGRPASESRRLRHGDGIRARVTAAGGRSCCLSSDATFLTGGVDVAVTGGQVMA